MNGLLEPEFIQLVIHYVTATPTRVATDQFRTPVAALLSALCNQYVALSFSLCFAIPPTLLRLPPLPYSICP